MKRYHILQILLGALLATGAAAQEQERLGLTLTSAAMQRNAGLMTVDLGMKLSDFRLEGYRVAVFTPAIVGERDSLLLAPVGIYSRNRWYQYLRSGEGPLGGDAETPIRWSERPASLDYSETVPYADWMNGAQLMLVRQDFACCREMIFEDRVPLLDYREISYQPVYRYAQPKAEAVKTRVLEGRAYIDFPVNRTELYPEYRNNPRELAKIIATIDSVRNDADVTVKRITIKGWASPESPWENNTRLAKGRTATLKQYVQNLYRFPEGLIETDYYPEDWIGLREFVAGSGLEHKQEILAIIDDPTLEPDPKEDKLKTTYPAEYKFLLATVYPGLRHSDYTIEYIIRNYTDVNEIRRVLRSAPQNLSLGEMYLLADTLEPGSEEFNELFETAVRMYPNDETANLNAANAAMDRNDLKSAERYVQKAGTSAEALYTRGRLAGMQGDYEAAARYFEQASATMPEASEAVEQLRAYRFRD